jgi:hypothetical protein
VFARDIVYADKYAVTVARKASITISAAMMARPRANASGVDIAASGSLAYKVALKVCQSIPKTVDRRLTGRTGETELVTDSSVLDGKKTTSCTGGLQSYCCAGFKPPPSLNKIAGKAADAAKDAAEAAAEQVALDIAAKAFCRVAVPALLAPLELAEDLIPIIG